MLDTYEIDAAIIERSVEPFTYTVDASRAGFMPGQWPLLLKLDRGNFLPFERNDLLRENGEIRWVDYKQQAGVLKIRIYND